MGKLLAYTTEENYKTMVELDLRTTSEGVTCEEYSLLAIAGPYRLDLPSAVRERMDQHLMACAYHNSRTFLQSALGTPVTPEIEAAALEVVDKYRGCR